MPTDSIETVLFSLRIESSSIENRASLRFQFRPPPQNFEPKIESWLSRACRDFRSRDGHYTEAKWHGLRRHSSVVALPQQVSMNGHCNNAARTASCRVWSQPVHPTWLMITTNTPNQQMLPSKPPPYLCKTSSHTPRALLQHERGLACNALTRKSTQPQLRQTQTTLSRCLHQNNGTRRRWHPQNQVVLVAGTEAGDRAQARFRT